MTSEPRPRVDPEFRLPVEPIDRLLHPITRFLRVEAASGVVLLLFTVAALVLANSPWAASFLGFWNVKVGFTFGAFEFKHSLKHLINDGLMTIFFFVIGLEVKREIVAGELQEFRSALLPIAAAIGGMVVPAVTYLALQHGQPGERGWGIPMATDIAFVVGCMALLGPRVPQGLRVLLLSLAIIDDIGAILVIAFGYSSGLNFLWLGAGLGGLGLMFVCRRLGVRSIGVYILVGIGVWFAFHESGVHATIAGVIIGLMTPARSYVSPERYQQMMERAHRLVHECAQEKVDLAASVRRIQLTARDTISPVEYLINALHPWVAFLIMPLFAFANAGVAIRPPDLASPVSLAVLFGLAFGKPLGVVAASWLCVRSGVASLPDGVNWQAMCGAGCLAGIGFTMALFIAGLALQDALLDTAKIGVLAGSFLSAVGGMITLRLSLPEQKAQIRNSPD
jgi:NhaA family Na+:H+ antiporter